jgi:putative addiction module component (TIGR02574 family)
MILWFIRTEPRPKQRIVEVVPLTLEQIVEETRRWPPEKVGELVERLSEDLHASDPEIEAAWKAEVNQRVEEIRSGKVQGIPGEEVSARIRKISDYSGLPGLIPEGGAPRRPDRSCEKTLGRRGAPPSG